MKNLTTLCAFIVACSSWAATSQTVLPPTYPFNPDSDGDEFVAVSDVLLSVAAFDNGFEASPLMVDTLTLEQAIQILLQRQEQNQQDLINGLSNSLSGVDGFDPCLLQWTCGGCPVEYNGHSYSTVQIGDQCWFAENLRSELYLNGDSIPASLSDEEWADTSSGAVAVFGEGNSDCSESSPDGDACDKAWSLNEYGRLYNWHAVDDARGLCPSGWHVPSKDEFDTLIEHLGGSLTAGTQMKTDYGWEEGKNGTNSSGFSGLPGGKRAHSSGSFLNAGGSTGWWTTSTNPSYPNNATQLVTGNSWTVWVGDVKETGSSVRCIQD